MKKYLALATLAALAGAGYYKLAPATKERAQKQEDLFSKYIVEAEPRNIDYTIEVSGDVTPEVLLDVKSEVGGKIKALYVEAGQEVKKGELLCEVDDTDLRNEEASVLTQLEGAKLSVERIELNFKRASELYKKNLITKENFENLASDLAIAKNNYSKVERQLQTVQDRIVKTRITAPTSGTLLDVKVIEGQVVIGAASVNNGTVLMTVADLSRLILEATINQIDVSRLQVNQPVVISMDSVNIRKMDGVVRFIAPVAATKNGVKGFQVKAAILNPADELRPGMTVNMSIPVAKASNALSVPISSVFKGEGNSRIVYVVEGSAAQARVRPVEIGVTSLDFAEIKDGLKKGERILLVEPRFFEKKS